jgi:hypothetical protein
MTKPKHVTTVDSLPTQTESTVVQTIMAHSLDGLLANGTSELRSRAADLRDQRATLNERRAHVQFALNAIDRRIGIIDQALQLIEAN